MLSALNELSNILQQNNTLFIALSTLLGLMVGSFLNVVIYRLPKMMEQEWHNNCLELQGKEISTNIQYSLSSHAQLARTVATKYRHGKIFLSLVT